MSFIADSIAEMDDEKITNFMGVTGCDHARAKILLESCNWDVNQAVLMHFADGAGANAGGDGAPGRVSASPDAAQVRAAIPSKRMRLVTTHDPYADVGVEFRQGKGKSSAVNPFIDYSGEGSSSGGGGGGGGGRSFAKMFAPPRGMLYSGDFDAAKRVAAKKNRWLLVNIQDVENFASHRLNRDTWKDELVKELVIYNCIFWQSDVSVLDAAK